MAPNIGNHELPHHQKPVRNRRRPSSDIETWNLTSNRDSSKDAASFTKNSDLDPIGDPPDVILRSHSVEELDPAARIKLPKGKRKSKAPSSSNSRKEDREARRAQSKMARKSEEAREPDRDDSSSTTTECSNADSEQSEKNNKVS